MQDVSESGVASKPAYNNKINSPDKLRAAAAAAELESSYFLGRSFFCFWHWLTFLAAGSRWTSISVITTDDDGGGGVIRFCVFSYKQRRLRSRHLR